MITHKCVEADGGKPYYMEDAEMTSVKRYINTMLQGVVRV